jgi:two-component system KDP operon response regulator KdpE
MTPTAAPASRSRVLIVDDDPGLLRAVSSLLGATGYDVHTAATGYEALEMVERERFEVIVLDLSLPDIDGVDVCARLREHSSVPVLVLSVRSGDEDKIRALDTGADDYVTKPFSAGVLVARIGALLRRTGECEEALEPLRADDLIIDFAARRVFKSGVLVRLTKTEFDILALLAERPGQVVRTNTILERVWGHGDPPDVTTLRTHMSNLRRKIERHPAIPRHVLTEPGLGFRFSVLG